MLRGIAACAVLLGLSAAATRPAASALAENRDSGLERGIKRVEAGEWNAALKDLSDAVRRLSSDPSRKAEAAQACLYSGLAYVGLGETSPAISQFAQALMRDPRIQIPAGRDSQAAVDAFEVARREAVAPPEPKAGRSKAPFVIAGVAAAGAGVALAASGGGSAGDEDKNPIPRTFTVTGVTGTPQLLLLSAIPPSSSTLHLMQSGAPTLTFVFSNEPSLPSRVRIFAEMVGPSGSCMTGEGEVVEVDRAVTNYSLVINSWRITCTIGFTTLTMNARLVDAEANIPISITSYSGGYLVLN